MADRLTAEQRAFLQERRFGVLATIDPNGMPQQSVIWYELQGERDILMNTKRGRRKDRNLMRDPRASICFEDEYRYLRVSGPISLEDNQRVAQADIERLAARYEGPEAAKQRMHDQFSKEERITVRLHIDHVYSEGFDEG